MQSRFQNRTRQIRRLGCPSNVGGQMGIFLAGEMGEGGQLGVWDFSFRKYVFLKMSSRGFKMGFARRFGMQNHPFGRDLCFCKVIFQIKQGKISGWGVPGTWVARWKFSWRGGPKKKGRILRSQLDRSRFPEAIKIRRVRRFRSKTLITQG